MATTKKRKAPRITCGGYSIEQNIRANADALRKAKSVDERIEVLDFVKKAFDRTVTRARDFYALTYTEGISEEDRDFLLTLREGHRRLAVRYAKMIWKVE